MDKKKVIELIQRALVWIDPMTTESANYEMAIEMAAKNLEFAMEELSKSDWVSVEDELPKYMEQVWVTDKEHRDFVWKSHRENGDTPKRLDDNGFPAWQHHYPYYNITHWRKIDKLEE